LTDNLKAICPTKPDNFDLNDSLDESIRKLKSNARNYSEQSLQQLLEVVSSTTKMPLKIEEKAISNISKLAEIMAKMDEADKRPSAFRTDFMNILETFEMNALLADTPEMRKLKNLLPKLNNEMLLQITDFVKNFNTNMKKGKLQDFKNSLETILDFKKTGNNLILGENEETGYKMIQFMKKTMRSLTSEFPNIIINTVDYENVSAPLHWQLSPIHQLDIKTIIKKHYNDFLPFYKDSQIQLLMRKMIELTSDVNDLAQNTLCYTPVELLNKTSGSGSAYGNGANGNGDEKKSNSQEKEPTFKYSAFYLDLTALLFKFYFFTALMDLISLQDDKEILAVPLKQLEESESNDDEESFMNKAYENDILQGNKAELAGKIASLIVGFTSFIDTDKKAINYNYKSLMDFLLRSKEKEKEEITDYLGSLNDEQAELEKGFRKHKLGRWSKGEQKGLHSYDKKTYEQEREDIEKTAAREAQLSKRSVVTDRNRDIFMLDKINEEDAAQQQENEDNTITYMGEEAEPEDYDMDGDENF
jgi:hypothetical protein